MGTIHRSKIYTVKPVKKGDPKRAFVEIRETIEPVPDRMKPRYFYNEIMDARLNTYSGRSWPLTEKEFKALLKQVQRGLDGEPLFRMDELEMPWDDL